MIKTRAVQFCEIAEALKDNAKAICNEVRIQDLKNLDKFKKLIAMVSVAYAFAINMGLHHHKKIKPIPLKNQGYLTNNFAKKGINSIREGIRREWKRKVELFYDFVLKFLRWIQSNPNNLPLPNF